MKHKKFRTFPLKILPRNEGTVYVPLNLEYLDEATKDKQGKIVYTKKDGAPGKEKETNFIYARCYISSAIDAEGGKIDKLLNKNLCFEFDPKNKKYPCKFWLFDGTSPYSRYRSPAGTAEIAEIIGLDTSPEDAVVFWNDPNIQTQKHEIIAS